MTQEQRIEILERRINELDATIKRLEKQQIKIVGEFDGTNVPVTINGIRKKIATSAP